MKPIELSVQEKDDFCVCSVLQAIFRKYNFHISQKEIACNLTSGKKTGFLVYDSRIKEFMKKNGFEYSYFGVHETPFNEPDELLKEICQHDGILGIKEHVYILSCFNGLKTKLINPSDGKEIEKKYPDLLIEMEPSGFFGLIKHIS
ncbi:Uncharacterised protein [uncultured archaeon]|nr:Uncharacterised protein [uncultured archaeon]